MKKYLPYTFVSKNYNKIMYKASDGKWYFLKDLYPICMETAQSKSAAYLDTGGRMETCHFDVYQFTKTSLSLFPDNTHPKGGKVADIKWKEE